MEKLADIVRCVDSPPNVGQENDSISKTNHVTNKRETRSVEKQNLGEGGDSDGPGEDRDGNLDDKDHPDEYRDRDRNGDLDDRNRPVEVEAEWQFLNDYMSLNEKLRKMIGQPFDSFVKSCIFRGKDCLDKTYANLYIFIQI
jgi:hypothetical protein